MGGTRDTHSKSKLSAYTTDVRFAVLYLIAPIGSILHGQIAFMYEKNSFHPFSNTRIVIARI